MIRRPPISTRTDTLFPYSTLFRSPSYRKRKALCAPSGYGQHCLSSGCMRWQVQDVTCPSEATGRHTHGGRRLRRPLKADIASASVDRQFGSDLRRKGHGFGGGAAVQQAKLDRSEERRVWKECVSAGRSRW